jgi:hypothetical protein
MKILCFPTTTVELVRSIYTECPRLSGPMVEALLESKNPHKDEIVAFLASANWFRMSGKDVVEQARG